MTNSLHFSIVGLIHAKLSEMIKIIIPIFTKKKIFSLQELKIRVQSDLDESMMFESRLQAVMINDQ